MEEGVFVKGRGDKINGSVPVLLLTMQHWCADKPSLPSSKRTSTLRLRFDSQIDS